MSGGGYSYNPYPNRFAAFGQQPNSLMAAGYPGSPGVPTYAQNPRNPNQMDMTGWSSGQASPGTPPIATGRVNPMGAQWAAPSPPSMAPSQPVNYMAGGWAKGYGDGAPPVGGGGTTPPGTGPAQPPGTGPGGYTQPVTPPVTPPVQPPTQPTQPPTGGRPGDFGGMPDNGRWWGSGPGPYPGGQPGMGNSPTNTAPMQAGQNSWGWQGPNNYTPMFNPSEKLYIQQMQNYGTGGNGPPAWWSQVDPNNMVSSIGQLSGVKFDPNSPMWKV